MYVFWIHLSWLYFVGIRTLHLKILARSQKALSFSASSLVFSFSSTLLQNIRWKCPFPNPTVDANEILNTAFCNHSEPSAVTCLDLWINELRSKFKWIIFLVTFMWNAAFVVFLWMSDTLSTPSVYQANCMYYYCLQQNEMFAFLSVVFGMFSANGSWTFQKKAVTIQFYYG